MSICRARLRNTSNGLTLRMSSEQVMACSHRRQDSFVSSRPSFDESALAVWASHRLNCSGSTAAGSLRWSGSEFRTLGPAIENAQVPKVLWRTQNWQLMTSGRSQVLATSNFRDWHTVVGEIPWSSVLKTTMDCHSKLVLHSLRNNQPVQVIVHQPRQTTLIFQGPSDQMCCSILNMLQLVHDLRRGGQNRVS